MANADHMGRITDDHVEELRKTHGRIRHVVYNGTDLVFRKPKRIECQNHAMKIEEGGAQKATADEQLAQLLIVHCGGTEGPDAKKAFLDLLEDYPYAVRNAAVGTALGELTGVVQEQDVKNAESISRPSDALQTTTRTG